MGREVKRVALDFDHPIRKRWPGYLCNLYDERISCPVCDGDGMTPAGRLLNGLWYLMLYRHSMIELLTTQPEEFPPALQQFAWSMILNQTAWCHALDQEDVDALLNKDRLWDFTRIARNPEQEQIVREKRAAGGNSWLPYDNGYRPTADEVNVWSHQMFGHDSSNAWICQGARAERYGVERTCPNCDGEGHLIDPDLEARINAWEPTEPPTGDGWQCWENVTEGSPVSPVFKTSEGLVNWLVTEEGYNYQSARAFVDQGWAMSAVAFRGPDTSFVVDGIQAQGVFASTQHEPENAKEIPRGTDE